jgi:hypothetical protein
MPLNRTNKQIKIYEPGMGTAISSRKRGGWFWQTGSMSTLGKMENGRPSQKLSSGRLAHTGSRRIDVFSRWLKQPNGFARLSP